MSAEILAMPRRSAAADPAVNQLEAYWSSLRIGGAIPSRQAVDPKEMNGLLRHAFIVEHLAPGVARIRVGGRTVRSLLGIDPAGFPLGVLFDAAGRRKLAESVDRVFDEPATLRLGLSGQNGAGEIEGEALLMPLTDACGATTMALGALSVHGTAAHTARRLSVTSVLTRRIVGGHVAPVQPRATADIVAFPPRSA